MPEKRVSQSDAGRKDRDWVCRGRAGRHQSMSEQPRMEGMKLHRKGQRMAKATMSMLVPGLLAGVGSNTRYFSKKMRKRARPMMLNGPKNKLRSEDGVK